MLEHFVPHSNRCMERATEAIEACVKPYENTMITIARSEANLHLFLLQTDSHQLCG